MKKIIKKSFLYCLIVLLLPLKIAYCFDAYDSEAHFSYLEAANRHINLETIASVEITYGVLKVGAGSGRIYLEKNQQGKIKAMSVKAKAGMLGVNFDIDQSESIAAIMSGQDLTIKLEGIDNHLVKVSGLSGFNPDGGPALIKIKRASGWEHLKIRISKNNQSQFNIYYQNRVVKKIVIQMRGLSLNSMVIGDYYLYH
jgi:hypothetical protein